MWYSPGCVCRRPGPPLVPTWLVERISRAIGCAPLLLWGRWGLPIPCPVSCLALCCRGQSFLSRCRNPAAVGTLEAAHPLPMVLLGPEVLGTESSEMGCLILMAACSCCCGPLRPCMRCLRAPVSPGCAGDLACPMEAAGRPSMVLHCRCRATMSDLSAVLPVYVLLSRFSSWSILASSEDSVCTGAGPCDCGRWQAHQAAQSCPPR